MSILPFFGKQKDKNINLLPEKEAKGVSGKRDIVVAVLIFAGSIAIIVITFASLFIITFQQSSKHSDLTKQIESKKAEWNKLSSVASDINQIKTNLNSFKTSPLKNKNTRVLIDTIRKDIPVTVVLSKMELNQAGEATLEGNVQYANQADQYLQILKNKSQVYSEVSLKSVIFNKSDHSYKFGISFLVSGAK